jgi:hypothetical protein
MDKLARFKERCKTDLRFLTVDVCGLTRWSDELHGTLASHLVSEGDEKMILLPRGHQKSTIVTVVWVIQQLLINPNETIGIYSATWKLSKDLLNQIKNIMISTPLKDAFGRFQPGDGGRWTIECIDIAQKDAALKKDPSISTGGMEGGKTGSHCSLMIFDDPVTPENTNTPELIRKTISSYEDCLPLLDPGGRKVVIGTRYANGDLYGKLIEEDSRSINGYRFKDEADRRNYVPK